MRVSHNLCLGLGMCEYDVTLNTKGHFGSFFVAPTAHHSPAGQHGPSPRHFGSLATTLRCQDCWETSGSDGSRQARRVFTDW